ncbi:MAG: hypothetical protein PHC64_02555 [Candidatus Gastranaerophilales bacterium]|nr:hypothetical protein [Candidatus Gastranaerophilales bacterium]
MTPSLGFFEHIKTNLFKAYSQDAGKMLLHTGTLGWIFSAAGQIFGIATNDEIPKEHKKFLIPQEIADAAINILSFYTLTAFIQNSAKKLASSGRIITPEIKKFCKDEGIQYLREAGKKLPNIGEAIRDKINTYQGYINNNIGHGLKFTPEQIAEDQVIIKKLQEFHDDTYAPFESGVRVIGNVIGAVISSNIVTPLLRNPLAAAKQKQMLAQEKLEKEEKTTSITPPELPKNRINMDDYRKKAALNPVRITTGGSMRV